MMDVPRISYSDVEGMLCGVACKWQGRAHEVPEKAFIVDDKDNIIAVMYRPEDANDTSSRWHHDRLVWQEMSLLCEGTSLHTVAVNVDDGERCCLAKGEPYHARQTLCGLSINNYLGRGPKPAVACGECALIARKIKGNSSVA